NGRRQEKGRFCTPLPDPVIAAVCEWLIKGDKAGRRGAAAVLAKRGLRAMSLTRLTLVSCVLGGVLLGGGPPALAPLSAREGERGSGAAQSPPGARPHEARLQGKAPRVRDVRLRPLTYDRGTVPFGSFRDELALRRYGGREALAAFVGEA